MPAGLEIYRKNGTKRFGLTSRPFNVLGVVLDTTIHNGSVAIVGGTPGIATQWFPFPLQSFNERIPTFSVANGRLYWTFAVSGHGSNCTHRVLYGEW